MWFSRSAAIACLLLLAACVKGGDEIGSPLNPAPINDGSSGDNSGEGDGSGGGSSVGGDSGTGVGGTPGGGSGGGDAGGGDAGGSDSGGGGSDDGGSGGSSGPALRFVPTSIAETLFERDVNTVTVDAFPQQDFEGYVLVDVDDAARVMQSNPQISEQDGGYWTIQFETNPELAVGAHRGELIIKLCRDSVCSAQHPGSPVRLPYEITVQSATNLTPLSAWPGISDWSMFQANAAHQGYVPVSLDPASFSSRWVWHPPQMPDYPRLSPAVTRNGIVYVSLGGYFENAWLYAVRESNATVSWHHDFGEIFAVNPPSVDDSRVYIASSGHEDTFMWGFDVSNGAQHFQTPFSSQWEHYYAPTLFAGSVYTNGGYYGGLNAFDAATGTDQWFTELNQYDEWTPAADANYVYAYLGDSCSGCTNNGLVIMDRNSGGIVQSIADSDFSWAGWSIRGAPILGGDGSVLTLNGMNTFDGNELVRFDVGNGTIDWTVSGVFEAQPSYAAGTVFAADSSLRQLLALSETDGDLIWSWQLPAGDDSTAFRYNIVSTDNIVFVCTDRRLYAIDRASHEAVWTFPKTGHLSISANGVLYIAREDGALSAVNLK